MRGVVRLVAVAVVAAGAVALALTRDDDSGQATRPQTVFLGDSITRGVSVETNEPSARESWVTYAVADPRAPWVDGGNAGIFGDTLDQMAGRFEFDVLSVDGVEGVVIMGGTNDVLQGIPTEESLAAARRIVEAAQDADLDVWLVAPPPLAPRYARSVQPLAEAERALADELDVPFADPDDTLREPDGGWPPGMSVDGVHPTVAGAQALADAILADLAG